MHALIMIDQRYSLGLNTLHPDDQSNNIVGGGVVVEGHVVIEAGAGENKAGHKLQCQPSLRQPKACIKNQIIRGRRGFNRNPSLMGL